MTYSRIITFLKYLLFLHIYCLYQNTIYTIIDFKIHRITEKFLEKSEKKTKSKEKYFKLNQDKRCFCIYIVYQNHLFSYTVYQKLIKRQMKGLKDLMKIFVTIDPFITTQTIITDQHQLRKLIRQFFYQTPIVLETFNES